MWRPLLLAVFVASFAGCATHVTTLRVDLEEGRFGEIRELLQSVAKEFEMTPAPDASGLAHRNGDWLVLGDFRRHRPEALGATGSSAYLVLLLYGSPDQKNVEVQLYDFSHGVETAFARTIREEIERRLEGVVPGRRISRSEERVRALPP